MPALSQSSGIAEKYAALGKLNALDGPEMKPWHLKVSYTRSQPGAEAVTGTLEEWWSAKDQTRVEVSEGASKHVYLRMGGERFRSENAPALPEELSTLMRDLQHPLPAPEDGQVLSEDPRNFGSIATNCYVLSREGIKPSPTVAPGAFPTFCADSSDALRVIWYWQGEPCSTISTAGFRPIPCP